MNAGRIFGPIKAESKGGEEVAAAVSLGRGTADYSSIFCFPVR